MTDETSTGDPATVLLVEDNASVADLYAEWLRPEYDVEVASDLPTALERLDETVDVALLDRHLPEGSGDDVLHVIRDIGLDCRVAMVTGVDPGLDVIEMGFEDYLCKPVERDELLDTVRGLQNRGRYREAIDEFYALVSKRALLETHCSADELAASESYEQLRARIDELEREVSSLIETAPERHFHAELVQLEQEADGTDANVE